MTDIREEIVERAAEKLVAQIRTAAVHINPEVHLPALAQAQQQLTNQVNLAQDQLETLTPDDLLEGDANFIGITPGTLGSRHQITRDSAKGVIQSFLFAAAFHGNGQTPPVMQGLENCLSMVMVDGMLQVSFDANLLDFAVRNVFRESRTLTNSFTPRYFRRGLMSTYRSGGYRGLPSLDCWAEHIQDKTIVFVGARDFFGESDYTQMILPEWACPDGPVSA